MIGGVDSMFDVERWDRWIHQGTLAFYRRKYTYASYASLFCSEWRQAKSTHKTGTQMSGLYPAKATT